MYSCSKFKALLVDNHKFFKALPQILGYTVFQFTLNTYIITMRFK